MKIKMISQEIEIGGSEQAGDYMLMMMMMMMISQELEVSRMALSKREIITMKIISQEIENDGSEQAGYYMLMMMNSQELEVFEQAGNYPDENNFIGN